MKIAWLSPLPPVRSGIASYSMMLLPEIGKLAEVTAVVDQNETDPCSGCRVVGIEEFRRERAGFDVVVCQVGNNIHHEFVWREAREHPSVLVLHELVLHHLVTEATLARADSESYVLLMAESEGEIGKAFARGRVAGLHFEEGNFLFPASSSLAAASRAIIVHNEWARDRLLASGVTTPIRVVDHPLDQLNIDPVDGAGRRLRQEHGFPAESRIIGMFGFVTQPKRPEVVFEAFVRAYRADPELRLLVVGEAAPNIDLPALARRFGIPDEAWRSTGWASNRQFDEAIVGVDRVVSLRYPSAGESSGAVARVFAAGKPIAVSDYAQFSELPGEIVVKIPLGDLEIPRLEQFMTAPLENARIAALQRQWIATHGDPAVIAREYLDVLEGTSKAPSRSARERPSQLSTLGILPCLNVDSFRAEQTESVISIEATISNGGTTMIRSHDWGGPAYRMIVKLMADGREITSAWWSLPGDLAPGDSVTVSGSIRGRGGNAIALVHGWVAVPMADDAPFFTGEIEG